MKTKTKVCSACKEERLLNEYYIYNKRKGTRYSKCMECHTKLVRATYNRPVIKEDLALWRLSGKMRGGLNSRKAEVTITREWIYEKLLAGHCEVTGLRFEIQQGTRSPLNPSMDQIEAGKGYTPNNCQMVVLCYNFAKHIWSKEDVVNMAKALISKE